jgi:SAM-dependent methyltransferase
MTVTSRADYELEEVDLCDLCGLRRSRLFEAYVRYGTTFNLVECEECGLAYVTPRPTQETIGSFYGPEYGDSRHGYVQPVWKRPVTAVLRELLAARYGSSPVSRALARCVLPWEVKWSSILRANHLSSIATIGRVLDVGCGHGAWLATMRRWGFDCVGCEPDPIAVRAASASGLNVVQSDLLGAGFCDGEFDVVRFSNVLEHVHNPTAVLAEACRVTKPGGIVVIVAPNHESLVAQAFRQVEDVPRHLFSFAPRTLRRYFDKVGLTMLECTTQTSEPHMVYGQFVSPAVDCLRDESVADDDELVDAFFAFRNRRRNREYRRTAAVMDALGLGRMAVAVGGRGSRLDDSDGGAGT